MIMDWREALAALGRFFYFAGVAAAIVVVLCLAARAQHQHPPQDAATHELFYKSWMRPDNPTMSCCNKSDCYPTMARFQFGHWYAQRREDGKWLAVPPAKIEHNRDSPDGRSHLCAPPPHLETVYEGGVICFAVGGGT